ARRDRLLQEDDDLGQVLDRRPDQGGRDDQHHGALGADRRAVPARGAERLGQEGRRRAAREVGRSAPGRAVARTPWGKNAAATRPLDRAGGYRRRPFLGSTRPTGPDQTKSIGRVIWRGFARRPDHQTNRSIETGCWSGRLAARTGEPSDDRTTTGPLSTLLLLAAVVGEKQARGPVAFVLAAAPPRPILALSGGGRESRKR